MDFSALNPVELIDQFKAKARSWWATYQGWQEASSRFVGTPLEAEYRALISNGAAVRSAIEKATSAIDSVASLYAQAKAALGFDGMPQGLGFLPLVWPAAILTTIALGWKAIDAWEQSARALNAKYAANVTTTQARLAETLIAQGVAPAEAARIVASSGSAAQAMTREPVEKPLLEQVKTVAIVSVVLLVAWHVLPLAVDWWKKRSARA